jgi:polyhydroxyalkanoate synthase
VSEPGHAGRSFQVATRGSDAPYVDPQRWTATVPHKDGSWWPAWVEWLEARSGAEIPSPVPGSEEEYPPLADAPGTYVLMD